MTITDSMSFWCTVVSIFVTLLSIGFSICSFISAKKAKQYKEETLQVKGTIELESLHSRFLLESQRFLNNTRRIDWYKGVDENTIISPFSDILLNFGKCYHLVQDATDLKKKVHRLHEIIQIYPTATDLTRKEITGLVIDITDILQSEISRNIKITTKS